MKVELLKLRKVQKRLSDRIHDAAKKFFTDECKELFVKHLKLQSFSWNQYTPYFNDGDECIFSVNRDSLDIKYGDEDFEEISDYTIRSDYYEQERRREGKEPAEGLAAAFTDISATLNTLEEDDFRMMFGDHVKVTVSAAGTDVNDYHHD